MAAIWKGSLTFGLVNIPVELRTAIRSDHITFRLLHEKDLSPGRQGEEGKDRLGAQHGSQS